jgi:hypothetical protein
MKLTMVLEIVKFLFGNFWHWLGLIIFIEAIGDVVCIKIGTVKSALSNKKDE